ncbi:MAG TPA: YbbR-like domain-containing protein [Bacteroidales bacterium]|nr:YbbR-like domain-containing protein [Bacteroidales bacterium]
MDPGEKSEINLKHLLRVVREKLINRNVAVFSFFLLLSFIFWFLNALSKDIESSVKYPVRYINLPSDLALVNELPARLVLDLEGPGYSILKTKIGGGKVPLVIDVSKAGFYEKSEGSELDYYISLYDLRSSFHRQLREEYNINSVSPDTLTLVFDRVISKRVAVKADVDINTQRQFMLNGSMLVEPDTVEISGPRALVDTISFVRTKYHQFSDLKEEVTMNLDIEPIPKVRISEKKTLLTIPVEQFTEEVIDVNIMVLNEPDTADVRLFPSQVNIHFNIALSDYNRLQEIPIEAYVDMKNLDVQQVKRLKVNIDNLPSFINNIRSNPKQVEYILEKK